MVASKKKIDILSWGKEHQEEFLANIYLELGDTFGIDFDNPLSKKYNKEDVARELVSIFMNPDYLPFTCKYLLNFNLFPYQASILNVLWHKRLPILIAARGGAKTCLLGVYSILRAILDQGIKIVIVGAGLRQSGLVFQAMEQIWDSSSILRDLCGGSDNGPRRDILGYKWQIGKSIINGVPLGCLSKDSLVTTKNGITTIGKVVEHKFNYVWSNSNFEKIADYLDNGYTPTKKIKTAKGFELEGTYDHKIKILKNNKIIWKRLDQLELGDRVLIDRMPRWFKPSFECTKAQAYVLGLLIGDGCWTNKYSLKFTSADIELVQAVQDVIGSVARSREEYQYYFTNKKNRDFTDFFEVDRNTRSWEKYLPSTILRSNKENMAACLSGLFDTDGHIQTSNRKGGISLSVHLTTTSKVLVKQVQYLLTHYGIIANVSVRTGRKSPRTGRLARDCYELMITGADVEIFQEQIGFRLLRKRRMAEQVESQKLRWVNATDEIPIDKELVLNICHDYKFAKRDIKRAKKITRKMLSDNIFGHPRNNCRIFEVEHLETIANPNIYYDEIVLIKDDCNMTVDINVPFNNEYCANGFYNHNTGSKIRGLRANVILCDEFASIDPEIFETVIRGFAAVQSQNTFELVNEQYAKDFLSQIDLDTEFSDLLHEQDSTFSLGGNQIVLSGTCSYQFNHFYKYYADYCNIILSGGRNSEGVRMKGYDHYAIMRVPHEELPPGFMDQEILEQGEAIMDSTIFQMEYNCIFPKDSAGFYPASIIDGATCPLKMGDEEIHFICELYGDSASQYVMGIDPASERDNLTISIAKLCDGYRAHVYTWSANRKRFENDKKKNKQSYEGIRDYNTFIVRKIHELVGRFNIVRIHIDSGGGGISIIEGLKDPSKLQESECLLFDIDDPEVAGEKGAHIIKLCQFTKRDWYEPAHYNLLKDLTARNYLFPEYDSLGIEKFRLFEKGDPLGNLMYDTVEGILGEVEETKYQTTLMEETTTAKGLKKWDLPRLTGVLTEDIVNKLRKDHFTSLLLCCDAARNYLNEDRTVVQTRGYAAREIITAIASDTKVVMYEGRGLGKMKQSPGNIFVGNHMTDKRTGGSIAF